MNSFESPQGPEYSPEIKTSLEGNIEITLNWNNTILNTFDDDRYNFLQILLPDKSEIITFPPDELVEHLLENRFPNYHRPLVPPITKEMVENYWLQEMDESLGDILGG